MDPPTIKEPEFIDMEEQKSDPNLGVSASYKNRLKIFEQHHEVVSNDGEVSEDLDGSFVESQVEEVKVIHDESPKGNKQDLYNFGNESPKVNKQDLYNFGDKPSIPDLPQNAFEDSLEDIAQPSYFTEKMNAATKYRPYTPPFAGVSTRTSRVVEEENKNPDDDEVEVVYDPVLNCYYDPKTHEYYELS